MKKDTILNEVIKQIKNTTGYQNVNGTDDFGSVNYDYGDVCIMTNFICKSLQLGEDIPGDIIHAIDKKEEELIYTEDIVINEYVDIVYKLICG